MTTVQREVQEKLKSYFWEDSFIDFWSPRWDDKHFELHIVSDKFEWLTRINRSRIVYDLLWDMLKTDYIHALRMSLKTYKEVS